MTELRNLTLSARAAYAVMCFERYTAFVYSDTDFREAAEIMWQTVDGSTPFAEAAERFLDIIPENFFANKTYAAYLAAGHSRLSPEQFRRLGRVLNPNDWNLNSMMKHIRALLNAYAAAAGETDTAPASDADAAETLAHLDAVTAILRARSIALPEPELLAQYACPQDAPSAVLPGGPVDPAPLSRLGISRKAAPQRSTPSGETPAGQTAPDRTASAAQQGDGAASAEAAPVPVTQNKNSGLNTDLTLDPDYNSYKQSFFKNTGGTSFAVSAPPVCPVIEANGCVWELSPEPDGWLIRRCINSGGLKEVTIPPEFNGRPVTAVGDNAFANDPESACRVIESLMMPDTVREIGDGFFTRCIYLRQIRLPAELERIGNDAFRGASHLASLDVGDRCFLIGNHFCADAVTLRTVTIGSGIEQIGQYTFYNTPGMTGFRCSGMLTQLGYGSFWMNGWADRQIFRQGAEMLRFCRDGSLLYRYVRENPPARLTFDASIRYVYDFALGGDAWNSGGGIRDVFFPGADIIGVNAFKKVPNATVHLSASRMEASYGPDYEYTLTMICEPAKVVFDLP